MALHIFSKRRLFSLLAGIAIVWLVKGGQPVPLPNINIEPTLVRVPQWNIALMVEHKGESHFEAPYVEPLVQKRKGKNDKRDRPAEDEG